MNPKDIIVIIIIGVLLALAIAYIIKAKKNGVKCIGCATKKCCEKSCCAKR